MSDRITKVFEHDDFAIWHVPQANGYVYEAAGIAVEPIRVDEYTGRRFTFFADPDGLPLELYESGGKAACTPENQGNGA